MYTLTSNLPPLRRGDRLETLDTARTATHVRYESTLQAAFAEQLVKRSFDILLAGVSLICVAPMLLVAMMLIMIEDPGAPIFTQMRVGQGGRLFRIFKLRTMRLGADLLHFRTLRGDDRLTRIGTILRQLNLDELPQLCNVLLGDMSIIGPRPLSLVETDFLIGQCGFNHDCPGLIPEMRPGLVGLEQVNRNRELTYEERFQMNASYERNWTVNSDLAIFKRAIQLCSPVCISVTAGGLLLVSLIAFLH